MCFVHVQAALHYIAWYSHTGAEYIKYLPRVNFAQTSRVWDEWNCKVDKYAVLNAHKKSSGALTHPHYGLHQCTYEPKISHTYSQLPTGSTGHQKSAMVMSVKCLYIAQQCWRLLFYGLRQSLRICISHQTRNGRRYSELHFRNSNNNKKKKRTHTEDLHLHFYRVGIDCADAVLEWTHFWKIPSPGYTYHSGHILAHWDLQYGNGVRGQPINFLSKCLIWVDVWIGSKAASLSFNRPRRRFIRPFPHNMNKYTHSTFDIRHKTWILFFSSASNDHICRSELWTFARHWLVPQRRRTVQHLCIFSLKMVLWMCFDCVQLCNCAAGEHDTLHLPNEKDKTEK